MAIGSGNQFIYVFFSVGLLGFIATAAANRTYKRLIREADHMEKSEHRLIKYIKIKIFQLLQYWTKNE